MRTHGLLRWSEKYFKTDMVYATKGNFWQMSGQMANSIMSIGLLFLFANLLPKETYGTYRYILSLASILSVLTLTGMNQAVSQAVANGREGVFKTSVKYQLKWNIMQLAAFWILSGYYFLNGNVTLSISFFVLGLVSPIIAALNTYSAFLDGKRNFKLNNLFSIAGTAIYVAGMIAAIMLSKESISLVIAYSLATLVSNIIFYFSVLKLYNPGREEAKDTLKYGRELTYIGFMNPIVSQIDKIILSHFWGATALAVYSLSMAVPERAISIIKSWVSIGLPKFASKTPEEINQVFYLRVFQGMGVGLICFIGYILIAPYMFKYLIPTYMEGLLYSQIIAISLITAIPNRYTSLVMTSQKLSGVIFTNSLIQSIIKIVLYTIMGMWRGIMGLVWAFVLMNMTSMFINIAMWRRWFLKTKFNSLPR